MRSVVEIGSNVPAFLGKLWKLVNDSETNHLISWSPNGKSFIIKNQARFAKELLPLYYKHNNMASFIRQLNMYGFHKINSVENGGLRYEKDEMQFSHACFMKGCAYLLEHIKRKIANPKHIVASSENGDKTVIKTDLLNKLLNEVKQMKGKQESLDAKFSSMKQENEALWREHAILRQKHIKQQQIVNNLIQFLMSLVQTPRTSNANGVNVGVKRPYQLMINNAAHVSQSDGSYSSRAKNQKLDKEFAMEDINEDNLEDGPTIHELPHDDLLHNEVSEDSLDPLSFVTVDLSGNPDLYMAQNVVEPSSTLYHVTMEDGEDGETDGKKTYTNRSSRGVKTLKAVGNSLPVISSPSPTMISPISPVPQNIIEQPVNDIVTITKPSTSKSKDKKNANKYVTSSGKLLSPSNFNTMNNTLADFKLPAEIFASDDSIGDVGATSVDDQVVRDIIQDSIVAEPLVSTSKDEMFGGINIKIENPDVIYKQSKKSKKSKENNNSNMNLAAIKSELQDDFDWNNMTLATVNNTNKNRFQTMYKRENIIKNRDDFSSNLGSNSNKNDIDDDLDTLQTGLDSLRDRLRSDTYSLDPNTLLGLFGSDDPFYGMLYNNPSDEKAKNSNNAKKKSGMSDVSSKEQQAQSLNSEDDAEGYQLMSYTGNVPYFEDLDITYLDGDNSQEATSLAPSSSSTLNTPQMEIRSPSYTMKP